MNPTTRKRFTVWLGVASFFGVATGVALVVSNVAIGRGASLVSAVAAGSVVGAIGGWFVIFAGHHIAMFVRRSDGVR
jgi:hypothetical protein